MGYAGYIGRVGALAVALGVGVALASTPAIAGAESGTTSSAGETSSATEPGAQGATDTTAGTGGGTQSAGIDTAAEPAAEADAEDASAADAHDEDGVEQSDADADQDPSASTETAADAQARDRDSAGHRASTSSRTTDVGDDDAGSAPADSGASEDLDEPSGAAGDPGPASGAAPTQESPSAGGTAIAFSVPAPSDPQQPAMEIAEVSDPAGTAPLSQPDPGSPIQSTAMLVTLAAVRDELERNNAVRAANFAAPQAAALLADPSPNVLVIGVDGTNLSRILANPDNVNFFSVMQGGTTAASTIVGHTTISNPSWTSILTGVWGERTGVINNVFNPNTYNRWPTVFNQLEALNPAIQTTAIADWNVIAAIADAGAAPADDIIFVPQVADDTNWSLTDDEVGNATEDAIALADPGTPNFIFSYFVGVDENGHMHGGASQQYADAITNVDRNLGEILQAVNAWELANSEQWTILMVTDHGHQPQRGLGHGFQSPDETSTFVIANNPDIFFEGAINPRYSIVDVTPTVMDLFGGSPAGNSDGVSLTTLGDGSVFPIDDEEALRGSLQDAIDMYGYPDIGTNLVLGTRTVFATVPYVVDNLTNSIVAGLQAIADQGIFLLSPLAQLAIIPVNIIGDSLYVVTNVTAQIVARLTGVTGASIFPLLPPNLPEVFGPEYTVDLAASACSAGSGEDELSFCGDAAIAV